MHQHTPHVDEKIKYFLGQAYLPSQTASHLIRQTSEWHRAHEWRPRSKNPGYACGCIPEYLGSTCQHHKWDGLPYKKIVIYTISSLSCSDRMHPVDAFIFIINK